MNGAASRRVALAVIVAAVTGLGVLVPVDAEVSPAAVPAAPSAGAVNTPMPCARALTADSGTMAALAGSVTPPDLTRTVVPRGAAADQLRRILLLADRYALGTQFNVAYAPRLAPYADLRNDAWGVRPPTSEALGLAVSTETGAYDASVVGRPVEQARAVAVFLTRSMACAHRAFTPTGWGASWQSPYYAAQLGMAGWLLWPHLSLADRALVAGVVTYEADRLLTYTVPYYGSPDGRVRSPGDTKAEENAWDATVLSLACAMMPHHPNRAGWMHKNAELLLSSYATLHDDSSSTVVNGAPLRQWLHGWNAYSDGTVVNHGRIHPDYMATVSWNGSAPISFGLAGLPTPRAAFHNYDLVYRGLRQRRFAAPPFDHPGGTIYAHGSGGIYYPQGNDWGYQRVVQFLLTDVAASLFGIAGPSGGNATVWERVHAERQLALQHRTDDGRTFARASENLMPDPEQWVFEYTARAWLAAWVAANHRLRVSDENLSATPAHLTTVNTRTQVVPATATPPSAPAGHAAAPRRADLPPGADSDLPSPPVPLDLGFPHPAQSARVPETVGDAFALDDSAWVPDGRGDIASGVTSTGASPRVVLTFGAPLQRGDALTIDMNLYDARGTARYTVMAGSRPDGSVYGGVVRVGDGRRMCGIGAARAVSGRTVSFALPRGCAAGMASTSLTTLTTIAGAPGGRAVVADILGG